MFKMQTHKLLVFTLIFLVTSCVTINIYFPAEKVKEVADEIVKEVRPEQKSPVPKGKKDNESLLRVFDFATLFSPPVAHAAEVTEVSNAVIRQIKARMKERYPQLVPFFNAGNIGENNEGYLRLRNASGLNIKTRARLNQLVSAENKDRKALYAAVAQALGISTSEVGRIAKIFAQKWKESSHKGWWIQIDNGAWVRK